MFWFFSVSISIYLTLLCVILLNNLGVVRFILLKPTMEFYNNSQIEYYYSLLQIIPIQIKTLFYIFIIFLGIQLVWMLTILYGKALYKYEFLKILKIYILTSVCLYFIVIQNWWGIIYDYSLFLFRPKNFVYHLSVEVNADAYLLVLYICSCIISLFIFLIVLVQSFYSIRMESGLFFFILRIITTVVLIFLLVFMVPDAVVHLFVIISYLIFFELLLILVYCSNFTNFSSHNLISKKRYYYLVNK